VFPGAQGVLDGLRKVDGDTAKYALDNKLVDAWAPVPRSKKP
jgi:protease-4